MNKIAQCCSQYFNKFAEIVVNVRWARVRMPFECWANGDPQFWFDIRIAAYLERTAEFVESYNARANAPKASDVELWPACPGKADDSQKRAAINFWPRRSPRLKSWSWIRKSAAVSTARNSACLSAVRYFLFSKFSGSVHSPNFLASPQRVISLQSSPPKANRAKNASEALTKRP